jgi:hypothetical protein
MSVEKEPHLAAFPILEFLFAHLIEIRRDPYFTLHLARYARFPFLGDWDEADEWFAIAANDDIFAGERAFDEA